MPDADFSWHLDSSPVLEFNMHLLGKTGPFFTAGALLVSSLGGGAAAIVTSADDLRPAAKVRIFEPEPTSSQTHLPVELIQRNHAGSTASTYQPPNGYAST